MANQENHPTHASPASAGPLSWRALLAQILKKREERERMAREIGVSSRTLSRWTHPSSKLPETKRELLLAALPLSYRAPFEDLMRQESTPSIQDMRAALPPSYREAFGKLVKYVEGQEEETISSEQPAGIASIFYQVAIDGACRSPEPIRTPGLISLLQQQMISLFGRSSDLALFVFQCQESPDGLIRSLRKAQGYGSGRFRNLLFQPSQFAGAESLAGQAVLSRQLEVMVQPQPIQTLLGLEGIRGIFASPIQKNDLVAGALVACTTSPTHLLSSQEQKLLHEYTQLLAVTAFRDKDFYAQTQIALIPLIPSAHIQERLILLSSQALARLRRQADHDMTGQEAEEALIQLIEQRLADEL